MEGDEVVDLTFLEEDEVDKEEIEERMGEGSRIVEGKTETADVVDVTDLVSPEKGVGGTIVLDDGLKTDASNYDALWKESQSKKDALKELVSIGKELRLGLKQRCQERSKDVSHVDRNPPLEEKETLREKESDQAIVQSERDMGLDASQATKETTVGKKRSKSSLTEEEKRERENEKCVAGCTVDVDGIVHSYA